MRLARPLSLRFANALLAAGNAPAARRFQADLEQPEAAQARTLARFFCAEPRQPVRPSAFL